MPTAAKLISAVVFGIAAFVVAEIYKQGVPERTVWGMFSLACAGISALCGWLVMGGLVGKGYRASMGYGLRTVVTAVFWVLLLLSTYMMIFRSMKRIYDGPMEALVGIFDLMIENSIPMLNPVLIVALVLSGVIGGMIAEWAGRRWR